MTLPVPMDKKETLNEQRARLASEFRYIVDQFNGKLTELTEAGLDVDIELGSDMSRRNEDALVRHVEVSYQTPRKYYVR